MQANLDALLTAVYVVADEVLPRRRRCGRPQRISDAEMVTLAIAQVLLDVPNETRWTRIAQRMLGHLFPYIPSQSGYNKRMRQLHPQLTRVLRELVQLTPSARDGVLLIDSTPVPCAQSRETVRRSQLAAYAGYSYCASHSRWFWGMRLHLLCASDGLPIAYELAGANIPEREVAAHLFECALEPGTTVIGDKNYAGRELEEHVEQLGGKLLRPDRKNERYRFGSLGQVRQWIESAFWTLKGQLSLERHGARSLDGLNARISQRLLALTACIWHNHRINVPSRSLIAYDH